jgi:hypothetical protein
MPFDASVDVAQRWRSPGTLQRNIALRSVPKSG